MLRAVPSPQLERPGGLDPSSCAWNFNLPMETNQRKDFERRFSAAVGEPFGMNWRLWNASGPKHIAVLVSRYDQLPAECSRASCAMALRASRDRPRQQHCRLLNMLQSDSPTSLVMRGGSDMSGTACPGSEPVWPTSGHCSAGAASPQLARSGAQLTPLITTLLIVDNHTRARYRARTAPSRDGSPSEEGN